MLIILNFNGVILIQISVCYFSELAEKILSTFCLDRPERKRKLLINKKYNKNLQFESPIHCNIKSNFHNLLSSKRVSFVQLTSHPRCLQSSLQDSSVVPKSATSLYALSELKSKNEFNPKKVIS